jgi:uncharacterized membrane protein (UPF0136 family)
MKKNYKKFFVPSIISGIIIGIAVFCTDLYVNPGHTRMSIQAGILLTIVSTVAIFSVCYIRSVSSKEI